MKRIFIVSALVLSALAVFSQEKLSIIKSTSAIVDIREDNELRKGIWTIDPKTRPDVYITSAKKIVFYTDIDSISFQVRSDKVFNFLILLNGKDSAFTQIKYKKSNLEVLKDAREYNFKEKSVLNRFTYKATASPDLLKIKQQFNLDSVAGKGTKISQIVNLLKWVNHSFKYDGTKDTPPFKDIPDLMVKCKNNEGTLHCGAMAWVLTDCYLAMGFTARQVICFPKDSLDFECHSTVAVFSPDAKKWLFMDPSNGVYVCNEQNEILSFSEFREYLIHGKIIHVNSDANINRYLLSERNYFNYMAKNLYAFQSFSVKDDKSISNLLLPLEYNGIFVRTAQNYPKVTHNPDLFWAKPE